MQVNVFSDDALGGNPLAVVVDAHGLDATTMQRFANWTNLSETTFLLPPTHPDADYRVRIFTPTTELPFAGHPTLGSCYAWLATGGKPKQTGMVIQECGLGSISIRCTQAQLAFAAPPRRKTGPLDEALLRRLIAGLGLSPTDIVDHQWLVNGPEWIGLHLTSAELVLGVKPNFAALKGLDIGLVGPYLPVQPYTFEVRAFAYSDGPVEDPVTGSLNAAIAQWLMGNGAAPDHYIASQGTALGRRGRVFVNTSADGHIWIGGHACRVIEGQVIL